VIGYLSIDLVGEWQPEEQVDEDQHDDENDENGDGCRGIAIEIRLHRFVENIQQFLEDGP
jgi:hypothetical protein